MSLSGSSLIRHRSLLAHWKPVVTVLVIATLALSGRYFQDEATTIYKERAALAANIERIKQYDAVLTDSALLAAATNNPAHERRYMKIAPKLDRLLDIPALVGPIGRGDAREQRQVARPHVANRFGDLAQQAGAVLE